MPFPQAFVKRKACFFVFIFIFFTKGIKVAILGDKCRGNERHLETLHSNLERQTSSVMNMIYSDYLHQLT